MKVAIIGAGGRLGRLLIEQALAAGHQVAAAARNPATITARHAKLSVVAADLLNAAAVNSALVGQEAVLGAVAPKMRQPTVLFSQGITNILAAMQSNGIRRLVWTTSAGVDPADAAAQGFFFDKVFRPIFLKDMYADALQSERTLGRSSLDWIVVRPTLLTNGPRTGVYRVGDEHVPPKGKKISRADVGDFMIRQLTADKYVHRTPALAY